MTGILLLTGITILQLAAGIGLLTLFHIFPRPGLFFSLALICGVAVFSIVPFILQLCYLPVTPATVFISLIITSLLLNIKYTVTKNYLQTIRTNSRFTIKLYEWPALLVIAALIAISVWRCFYFPPTPRDFISGPEVIAEYTVQEGTMINSVFTVNLESTNNPFKSPYLICLQVIYKMAGFLFGQLWLSALFISFIIFLYHALCITLHRLIAGILMVVFLAIPEMYAYSFMALYDYSNAVFFFLACYFLLDYFDNDKPNYLFFSALLLSIATYIRSETIVLAGFTMLLLGWQGLKNKKEVTRLIKDCLVFILPAVFFYVLTVIVYLGYYLPVKYDVGGQVNHQLANLSPLVKRFVLINKELIFSQTGLVYYGYLIFIFLFLLAIEIVFNKGVFTAKAKNWLIVSLIIYLGYPILGYLLPLLDIDNSTKRGLFKLFPLLLLYMANSNVLLYLSGKITSWENRPVTAS